MPEIPYQEAGRRQHGLALQILRLWFGYWLGFCFALAPAVAGEARHAMAMHGEPALAADFSQFGYVNPQAPKGGRLTQAVVGTFDSLNPFIVKGLPADGIRGYVIEPLMARNYDEPFAVYPLLARSIETDASRSYVSFELDAAAAFSDGQPVTAADVIFSWQLLREKGRPNLRTYYTKVTAAQALGERTVRFDLAAANDRELPLILALMPVLPRHRIEAAHFDETTLHPLLGSGPYAIDAVSAGKTISFKRNPAYWGRNLPVNRGMWNFNEIRIDYYRDGNAAFEAFKRGLADVRIETDPGRWKTAYGFPAARQRQVVQEALPTGLPKPLSGFVFNTRRAIFADRRVRDAITMLFDFEWLNHNFFYDLYQRTGSYFEGSELSCRGRPASPRERALLLPFANDVRSEVLEGTWSPPVTDGSGRDRRTLELALALLASAGYELRDTHLVERASGRQFSFEILVSTAEQERLALALARDLQRAGISPSIRRLDAVQYEARRQTFDFDMIQYEWSESLSPGNEQSFYWGSAAAEEAGSRNYMGVRSTAIDAMIAAMLRATTREDFEAAVRALDRLLISGTYVIPLFHLPEQWLARWSRIERPARTSLFGYLPETWWHKATTSEP